jgi:hypothetical protein|tara:strand:+ start:473 stop:625 length:153 start_codon:yes stop_codon:yes gene_type:complete
MRTLKETVIVKLFDRDFSIENEVPPDRIDHRRGARQVILVIVSPLPKTGL